MSIGKRSFYDILNDKIQRLQYTVRNIKPSLEKRKTNFNIMKNECEYFSKDESGICLQTGEFCPIVEQEFLRECKDDCIKKCVARQDKKDLSYINVSFEF